MKTDKPDRPDFAPVCPHCGQEVDRLLEVKGGWFDTKRIYCCPHCRKIVGVNRK